MPNNTPPAKGVEGVPDLRTADGINVAEAYMQRHATWIQARAVRRCGELLKQFDGRGEHRKKDGVGLSSQSEIASAVGISERQAKTAVRVANVAAVEGTERHVTVTKLAELSRSGAARRDLALRCARR